VPDDELIAAVRGRMVKVDIGTALNSAVSGAVQDTLENDAALVEPGRHLAWARTAMADTPAGPLLAATTTRAR
jgi:fructose-bisphosphate aldolase class II